MSSYLQLGAHHEGSSRFKMKNETSLLLHWSASKAPNLWCLTSKIQQNSEFQFFGPLPYLESAYLTHWSTSPTSDQASMTEETSLSPESEPAPGFVPATWPELEDLLLNIRPLDHEDTFPMADIIVRPPKTMPGQNHHLAPKFDGKPVSLARFLNKIEQLAEDCGLSAKQTINWTL